MKTQKTYKPLVGIVCTKKNQISCSLKDFAWKITDNNAKHKQVVKLLKGEILTAEFIHHPCGAVKVQSPLFEDTGPPSPSVKMLLTCKKQKNTCAPVSSAAD